MTRNARRHPIARLLALHDRTVADLAQALHVSPSTIYSWTAGNRTPNQRSLSRMLQWFVGFGLYSNEHISAILLENHND